MDPLDQYPDKLRLVFGVAGYLLAGEPFLAKIILLAQQTQTLVNKARLRPGMDLETLQELNAKWLEINSSVHFFLPSRQRLRLKKLCLLISIDIGKLDSTPSEDDLESLSLVLKDVIKKAEELLHGDPSRIAKAAIRSTIGLLNRYQNTPQKLYSRDEYEISEPILLWNMCRRLSRNTKPRLYHHADVIIGLYNRVVLSDREERQLALDELRDELKSVAHYLNNLQLRSLNALFVKGAFLSGVVLLGMTALGLHDFTLAGRVGQNKTEESDGEKILIPTDKEYSNQMSDICRARRHIKAEAVEAFSHFKSNASQAYLSKAQRRMQDYLNLCPSDAEAQIYFNNYDAFSLMNQNLVASKRPVATLAVVAPLSRRKNGIRDSLEVLRGISLAQFNTNRFQSVVPNRQPIILIKIFDDGLPRSHQGSDLEENKRAFSLETAKAIVTDEKNRSIVGVVGHFSSGSTEETSKIYYAHNMPVVSATSTNLREPLSSHRYRVNGIRFMHRILDLAPPAFASNFASNYSMLLGVLRGTIHDRLWPVKDGHLDLDPNIFRMPPNDADAQGLIFDYLRKYNATSDPVNQVNEITLIWEDKDTSTYSLNYRISLRRLAENNNYVVIDAPCQFFAASAIVKNARDCKSRILANPAGTKALIVFPSPNNIDDAISTVNDIIDSLAGGERLIVFGADSLVSALDEYPTTFNGAIISSASEEAKQDFPLQNKTSYSLKSPNKESLRLTWRSQMAHDSVILFAGGLERAFRDHSSLQDVRSLRSYLLDVMQAGVDGKLSNKETKIRFREDTHDRDIRLNSTMNVLLCKTSHGPKGGALMKLELTSQSPFCKP